MITIKAITTEGAALDSIRQMFVDYQKELDADLCFQSFNQELAQPLKKYGPPSGIILLAYYNDDTAGCVAVTAMKEVGVCEMKRLYVKPSFRQFKIGQALVEAIIASAATMGYNKMRLDTLQKLQPAIRLYRKFGFTDTSAYYHNPLQEVVYMERELG
jgi:GNAT superfamily N-acetyltransferase